MTHTNAQDMDLLDLIRAFCARAGVKKTRFGREACGDPGFVADLERGREPRRRTVRRVMEYITTGEPFNPAKHSMRGVRQ